MPVVRIAAVAGIVLCWWMARRAGRTGLEVDETGIVRLGAFQTQHVTWDEIVGLSTTRVFASVLVYLNLADGRRLQTGLVQGPTVVWQRGETKDIVSVLQHELDVRGALTARPSQAGS